MSIPRRGQQAGSLPGISSRPQPSFGSIVRGHANRGSATTTFDLDWTFIIVLTIPPGADESGVGTWSLSRDVPTRVPDGTNVENVFDNPRNGVNERAILTIEGTSNPAGRPDLLQSGSRRAVTGVTAGESTWRYPA